MRIERRKSPPKTTKLVFRRPLKKEGEEQKDVTQKSEVDWSEWEVDFWRSERSSEEDVLVTSKDF